MSRWRGRVAVVGAGWAGVVAGAWVLGSRPDPLLLLLVVGTLVALASLLVDLLGAVEPVRWPPIEEPPPARPVGEDPRLARLRHLLVQHRSAHEVGDALHRELAALAERRLVLRHGITPESDPGRASELLGPDLSRVLAARAPYPRLTLPQIDALLRRIEDL